MAKYTTEPPQPLPEPSNGATWSDWTIEVTGLVDEPRVYTVDEMAREFPPREFPVTLVEGGPGSSYTSVWGGVALRDVLKSCGAKKCPSLSVRVEGADGGGGACGTSLKVLWAMEKARDIILAYKENGEKFSSEHGFPIRLIVPGSVGGGSVMWVKKIDVVSSDGGRDVDQGDVIINELNINSVITTPSHDEILHVNSSTIQRPYTLKGYAYSGGGRKVIRVEISLDGGETWRVCKLYHSVKPNEYGRYWCRVFWTLKVVDLHLLCAEEIAVQASDESHNTQPEKPSAHHIIGMMDNSCFKVKNHVDKPQNGEIKIVFKHPTRPGNQTTGGWMVREPDPEQLAGTATSSSSNIYSLSEVSKHASAESAWIVVRDCVYDCTEFLPDHPDGSETILCFAGTDCTETFESVHSRPAQALLGLYKIGELQASDSFLSRYG